MDSELLRLILDVVMTGLLTYLAKAKHTQVKVAKLSDALPVKPVSKGKK